MSAAVTPCYTHRPIIRAGAEQIKGSPGTERLTDSQALAQQPTQRLEPSKTIEGIDK
jgi:hypothetical protein